MAAVDEICQHLTLVRAKLADAAQFTLENLRSKNTFPARGLN